MSAKAIRNEASRLARRPIEVWLADTGFTPDDVRAMGGDEIADAMQKGKKP